MVFGVRRSRSLLTVLDHHNLNEGGAVNRFPRNTNQGLSELGGVLIGKLSDDVPPKRDGSFLRSGNAGVIGDESLNRTQQAWDVQRFFKNSRDMGRFCKQIGPVTEDDDGKRHIFASQTFNLTPAMFVADINIQENEIYVCSQS